MQVHRSITALFTLLNAKSTNATNEHLHLVTAKTKTLRTFITLAGQQQRLLKSIHAQLKNGISLSTLHRPCKTISPKVLPSGPRNWPFASCNCCNYDVWGRTGVYCLRPHRWHVIGESKILPCPSFVLTFITVFFFMNIFFHISEMELVTLQSDFLT